MLSFVDLPTIIFNATLLSAHEQQIFLSKIYYLKMHQWSNNVPTLGYPGMAKTCTEWRFIKYTSQQIPVKFYHVRAKAQDVCKHLPNPHPISLKLQYKWNVEESPAPAYCPHFLVSSLNKKQIITYLTLD